MLTQVGRWLRSQLRTLLWWVWPGSPTSFSQLPARLAPTAIQVGRLTVAAVVAYVVAGRLVPGGAVDLTAPLTALLVVQASTVGTLRMGLVRVGAVLTGVLVAVAVAAAVGLTWWSLGLVIAASLVLAKVLRLARAVAGGADQRDAHPRRVEPGGRRRGADRADPGRHRGRGGLQPVAPVAIPNARAAEAVRRVARSQAALLHEVALALGGRAPQPEEVAAWMGWTADIDREIERRVHRRRGPPRRAAPSTPGRSRPHGSTTGCARRSTASTAAWPRSRRCWARSPRAPAPDRRRSGARSAAELRRAFAVVLDDLADGLRAARRRARRAALAARSPRPALPAGSAERLAEIVRESRAVLTELVLLDVDPRRDPGLWLVQGSMLSAVDQVLTQLDLEVAPPASGRGCAGPPRRTSPDAVVATPRGAPPAGRGMTRLSCC